MTLTDAQIRDKLSKIKALFDRAGSAGERQAAQAAMGRLQQRIDGIAATAPADPPVEFKFSFENPWSKRLFMALCRSKGYKPYRYRRMRYSTVCVQVGRVFVKQELWPEYLQMNQVLTEHLEQLADSIIADSIDPDRSDAAEVPGIAGPGDEGAA